jgi:carbonic anhydrase
MERLIEGVRRFQSHVYSAQRQLFERLVEGQEPLALFISCSDSRINPNLITQTEPGELFIFRNAGNIIPPYGASNGGEAAAIEYAVSVLKVEDIIVCGHSRCGAIGALLHPETVEALPSIRDWLLHAEATRRIISENYSHLVSDKSRLTAAVEENVLVQLENLRTHPCVAAALAREQLNLHAWVYELESGKVFAFDSSAGQFLPLGSPASGPRQHRRKVDI